MSDPMNRPIDPPPPAPPPESQPRRGVSPLIWLVLLAAVIALAWYVYTRRSVDADMPAPMPPAAETADATVTPDDTATATPEPAASAPGAPARPAMPDREAQPIARLQPEYPPAAFRAGEEGTVLVRAEVDANGVPTRVEIADGSGSRELDRAGMEAVRKWRFEPAVKDGQRVASTVQVPVDFKLDRQ